MNPIVKSLLAEISPAFLRARKLVAKQSDPPEASAARRPERPSEWPSEPVAQRPCYRPPKPDSRDTASNM